jgi:2-polyprenyl-6-hydroxyphenyl methylase/3-demethylubiquinone-9 3-methyltransferase
MTVIENATSRSTVDPAEVGQFDALSDQWWDRKGAFAALHRFTPVRMQFFRDALSAHFMLDRAVGTPLCGLRVLDIGCGGGLIAEPLARLGATVTAIDAASAAIDAAKAHASAQGLQIDYRCTTAEAMVAEGNLFDVVVASEVIEHVASIDAFIAAVAQLLDPDGVFMVTTINRSTRSLLSAKFAAEYILRWAPVGTHDWHKFVRPAELKSALGGNGLHLRGLSGFVFRPLRGDFHISSDCAVNYGCIAVHAKKATQQ